VVKERRLLLYRHTRIHLDAVEGLGSFLELETVLDGIGEEEGRRESAEVAAALGVRADDLLEGSYGDLVSALSEVPARGADILSRRAGQPPHPGPRGS
jgi:predicted adenylyl cyclase CyaB